MAELLKSEALFRQLGYDYKTLQYSSLLFRTPGGGMLAWQQFVPSSLVL